MSTTRSNVIPMRRPTSPDERVRHVDHGQPEWVGNDTWHAETAAEATALAHLRGWTHHGPACPICMGDRR